MAVNLDSEVTDRAGFQPILPLASCRILSLNFSFLICSVVEGEKIALAQSTLVKFN